MGQMISLYVIKNYGVISKYLSCTESPYNSTGTEEGIYHISELRFAEFFVCIHRISLYSNLPILELKDRIEIGNLVP